VILESFEVSSRILTKDISNFVFFSVRAPEVSNVCSLSLSHIVKSMVKSFFLCYKPLIHFERTNFLMSMELLLVFTLANLVNLIQISS